jgi:serine protease Do
VLKLKTGQRVLLVGAAFAGTSTVADGIISHHSRFGFPLSREGQFLIPYVATTVPVHPGNGGGALFDARGEVVAMVTQMYISRSDPFATVSFAVPGDVIRFVADSLRTRGYVSRGAIRITIQEVTKELADTIGMAKPRGALVNATQPGGPADRAGIVAGDIILQFNGQPVNSSRDIPTLVASVRPGTRVPVQVWRKWATVNLTLEIEELEPGR